MDLKLEGRVAIVTGGSHGIGRATAQTLAAEGARVVICARHESELFNSAHEIQRITGGVCVPVVADVTSEAELSALVDATIARFGGVDILVNNAGQSRAAPFRESTAVEWLEDYILKVLAAVEAIRLVVPSMVSRGGGRIVNVISINAKTPRANTTPTSISRAAGLAMTKALSRELAVDGILVNAVCVGAIESRQHERRIVEATPAVSQEDYYNDLVSRRGIPRGRVGKAEEVAEAIAFLSGFSSSFITGVALNVDGGECSVT